MASRRNSPSLGFRFSRTDFLVLIVAAVVGSAVMLLSHVWIAVLMVFVVGHFFLFCNVFRVSRCAELSWAAITIMIWGLTSIFETPDWLVSLVLNLVTTAIVIAIEIRRIGYHGAWWDTLNPSLQV